VRTTENEILPMVSDAPTGHALVAVPASGCGRGTIDTTRENLHVADLSAGLDWSNPHRAFNISLLLSGLRCVVAYVVAPFVVPALGLTVIPALGLALSCVALVFDVRGLRRLFVVQHPYRWAMAGLYLAVVAFVLVVIFVDVTRLAR
jgi:hypothetical protein